MEENTRAKALDETIKVLINARHDYLAVTDKENSEVRIAVSNALSDLINMFEDLR